MSALIIILASFHIIPLHFFLSGEEETHQHIPAFEILDHLSITMLKWFLRRHIAHSAEEQLKQNKNPPKSEKQTNKQKTPATKAKPHPVPAVQRSFFTFRNKV